MDDSRQKNFFLIGFLFIVIIFINVYIKSVDLSAKPTKSSQLNTNNNVVLPNNEDQIKEENKITNEEVDKQDNNENNSKYYYSSDDKYYLILTENKRNFSNEEMGTTDNRYILNIDEYYSTNSLTGKYIIENNTITLFIEAGCKNEKGDFNCVIPDGIKINKINNINTMTLEYNDKEIYLGNIKLALEN